MKRKGIIFEGITVTTLIVVAILEIFRVTLGFIWGWFLKSICGKK